MLDTYTVSFFGHRQLDDLFTVKRAIHDLKAAGYLETEQRWRTNGGKSSLLFQLLK